MSDAGASYDQDCPITGQPHRYFIFKTFENYEPTVTFENGKPTADIAYYKREIAVLGCNCGSVIRREVEKI